MRIDRRVVVPALAALSVTALGVSVALVAGDPDAEPRTLRLGDARASADAALGAPGTESGYELVGTLPSGRPDDAPAWTLPGGPADAEPVQALARALEAGLPVRAGSDWRAGGLTVAGTPGQPWWWSPCPDGSVSSDGEVRCATATPGVSGGGSSGSSGSSGGAVDGGVVTPEPPVRGDDPTPVPEPTGKPVPLPEPTGTPVPETTVTAAARPVLEAVGLSVGEAVVTTSPYGGSAAVTPEVGGLPAVGFTTRVDVSRDGTVTSAGGWLATPRRGDTYPLITAQEAFEGLPPRMVAMLCPIGPDGQGCTAPPPAQVTGARLGLSVQALRDGGSVLVPSWLFTLKDNVEPVPVVAVEPEYLDTGDSGDTDSGDDAPGPTDKPVPEPTAVPPAPGGTEPGQTDPGAAREAFSFDAAWPGDTPTSLVVRYGDSSSCVREHVTDAVKEADDAVYVLLEADARDPGLACTDDYRAVERVIRLEAPLGDRKVVDASSGRPVPLGTAR